LNPIELAFAKPETLLRKRGERTMEGPWNFLSEALDRRGMLIFDTTDMPTQRTLQ